MLCGHGAQTITREVAGVEVVQNVNVDLGRKRVIVEANDQVTSDTIVLAINESGDVAITLLNEQNLFELPTSSVIGKAASHHYGTGGCCPGGD
jgi:copper chaperone CopZ